MTDLYLVPLYQEHEDGTQECPICHETVSRRVGAFFGSTDPNEAYIVEPWTHDVRCARVASGNPNWGRR